MPEIASDLRRLRAHLYLGVTQKGHPLFMVSTIIADHRFSLLTSLQMTSSKPANSGVNAPRGLQTSAWASA
jgi:hypothetical protein